MLISKPSSTSSPFFRGFTLIEMMVVVAIFLVVMGVILTNLPNFREQKILDLVAQEVVTTVRQVQVYGVSKKKLDIINYPSYGIHFDENQETQFIIFADIDGSKTYGGAGEIIETYKFPSSIQISSVSGGVEDIVYTSPNIDPDITPAMSEISVVLTSLRTGQTRTVYIAASGMVYTQ